MSYPNPSMNVLDELMRYEDANDMAASPLNFNDLDASAFEQEVDAVNNTRKMYMPLQSGGRTLVKEEPFRLPGMEAVDRFVGNVGKDVANNVMNTVMDVEDFLRDKGLDIPFFRVEEGGIRYAPASERRADLAKAKEQGLPRPNFNFQATEGAGAIEQAVQPMASFIGTMLLTPGGLIPKTASAAFTMDPELGNLSTFLKELGINNEVIDFLDSKVDAQADAEQRLIARVKNLAEEGIISGALEATLVPSLVVAKQLMQQFGGQRLPDLAAKAQARIDERSASSTLYSGVDPTPLIDEAIVAANKVIGERRVGTTGQYVGAPPGIDSPEKMAALRQSVFDLAEQGGIEVYQGRSKKGLTEFFNPDNVSWGSTSREPAEQFALRDDTPIYPNRSDPYIERNDPSKWQGQVYKLKYDIKNPMEVDIAETMFDREKELLKIAEAKSKGHDGLKIVSKDKNGKIINENFVAFDRSQVTLLDDYTKNPYVPKGLLAPQKGEIAEVIPPTDNQSGIIAFHGSGADFDEFKLDKIGSGEGAQMYGYGLYFTEKESIAKYYKNAVGFGNEVTYQGKPVSLRSVDIDGKPYIRGNTFNDNLIDPEIVDELGAENGDLEAAIKSSQEFLDEMIADNNKNAIESTSNELAKLKALRGRVTDNTTYTDTIVHMIGQQNNDSDKIRIFESEQSSNMSKYAGISQAISDFQKDPKVYPLKFFGLPFEMDDALRIQNDFQQKLNDLKEIGKNFYKIETKKRGKTYKVELAAKPEELLDYDLPFSDQSAYVKKALRKHKDAMLSDSDVRTILTNLQDGYTDLPGAEIVDALKQIDGTGERASKYLNQLGIKGIKYRASGSRNPNIDTKDVKDNFVIFDDAAVNILAKYGIVGPVAVTALSKPEPTKNEQ